MQKNNPNKKSQFWSFFAATLAICFIFSGSFTLQGDNRLQFPKIDTKSLVCDFKQSSCSNCGMEFILFHSSDIKDGVTFQYTFDPSFFAENNDLFFIENILCQPENGEPSFFSVRNIQVSAAHLRVNNKFTSQHFPLKIAAGNYIISLSLQTTQTGKSWHHTYSVSIDKNNEVKLNQIKLPVIKNSFYRV
ncbi:MAG: hypothetical protein DWQ05_13035 [Calditrichaeota bacterium]|nr:MAG: hypothetical protein DWQ05_13035 [Calditrichota bacterium]